MGIYITLKAEDPSLYFFDFGLLACWAFFCQGIPFSLNISKLIILANYLYCQYYSLPIYKALKLLSILKTKYIKYIIYKIESYLG